MTIIYYDKSGAEIAREEDTSGMSRAEIEAWLNDNNVEQAVRFDTFEVID